MKKRRVLLLTQWFDPEPTFKGLVFAKALVKEGFDVEVVTGFPNYPGGTVYKGYKIKLFQKEKIEGVDVCRLPLYPSHDNSALKRIFNYVSFALSALFYCLFFAKRPDVMYVYHPPLTTGVVAVITRFFRKVPIVYDVQDMWPDTLKATNMLNNKRILAIIGIVADWVYKRVDRLVVLSPGFKTLLIERQVNEDKIDVIPNWCSEYSVTRAASDLPPKGMPPNNYFKILFAGNLGKAQALDTVVAAAKELENSEPYIAFVFLGSGIELESLKKQTEQCKNVYFIPQVSMEQVGDYLNNANVLLVHLKNEPLFQITIPSKMQAYMAAGKPIIMGVKGDAANVINTARCGIVVEPENSVELVGSVKLLHSLGYDELQQMGLNGYNYYHSNLSLKIGVQSFSKIMNRLISQNGEK